MYESGRLIPSKEIVTLSLLISPHDDDSVLFAAATCCRQKPAILVCLDSWVQVARGEIGCSAEERAAESERAHAILGCKTLRLGLRDDNVTEEQIVNALAELNLRRGHQFDTVYAPALQGGNDQHDIVSRAAKRVFGSNVIFYTTYSKEALYTEGNVRIIPTEEELDLKRDALYCFESQLRVNMPHFRAVLGKSEWLMEEAPAVPVEPSAAPVRLHLGCGKNILPGYINVDKVDFPGISYKWDICMGIPLDDNSVDYVASQDLLEHIPPENKVFVINEIWRVLKPGGIMEHNVPNAGSQNDFGSPTHLSHWSLQQFEHWDVDSYRYEKDREFEGICGGFRKLIAELVNVIEEYDGVKRAQSIHVKYQAVKE